MFEIRLQLFVQLGVFLENKVNEGLGVPPGLFLLIATPVYANLIQLHVLVMLVINQYLK